MPRWTATDAARWVRPHQTKARFLAAGALNTALGLAMFPTLMWTLGPRGFHYMVVLVISQVICVTFAYSTQKVLVFRTKGNYISEFGRFILFYVQLYLVNLAVLPFLVEIVHIRPIIAQFCFSVPVIVTSYFWHSRITFKPQAPDR
jgi:putative flippase GtrA